MSQSEHAFLLDPCIPFASGSFKNVWLAEYSTGPREGQKCVAKAFRTGSVFEEHFFELEMRVIEETRKIISAWNKARIITKPIKLNIPEIYTRGVSGEMRLIEPFIKNFQKFNSNSGNVWDQGHEWSDALQALSHFSYDHSGGRMLLCDIQGGIYRRKL